MPSSARKKKQRVLERPHHQGERRAELVADVGEELRLELVELRELLALAGDLALVRLLLGDVAPLCRDEHDLGLLVRDGLERRVDDDRLPAAGAAVDLRVPADELALFCFSYCVADRYLHSFPARRSSD